MRGQLKQPKNSKRERSYTRTQPHVLCDAVSTTSGSAKGMYQNLVAAAGPTQASSSTGTPHNIMQIKNVMRHQRTAGRLTHDALFNLHKFAYDTDFVEQIITFPGSSYVQFSNCQNIQDLDVNDKQWYACVGLNL